MELEFKPVVAGDIDRLRPFYGMRPNKTCDSVFLDSFLWKDYYHVQCAVSEGRAVLWLMEKDGQVSTEVLDITIEQLASWLFGYSALEELAEGEQNGAPFWSAYVQVLDGVYLDEVV